jgi:hypothetical protein
LCLGAALYLETAYCVGPLQHFVDSEIIQRQVLQVGLYGLPLANMLQCFFNHAQCAQCKEINLDQPGVFDAVLIPLHHYPSRHGGPLHGHDLHQRRCCDQHTADVNREVTGDAIDCA